MCSTVVIIIVVVRSEWNILVFVLFTRWRRNYSLCTNCAVCNSISKAYSYKRDWSYAAAQWHRILSCTATHTDVIQCARVSTIEYTPQRKNEKKFFHLNCVRKILMHEVPYIHTYGVLDSDVNRTAWSASCVRTSGTMRWNDVNAWPWSVL